MASFQCAILIEYRHNNKFHFFFIKIKSISPTLSRVFPSRHVPARPHESTQSNLVTSRLKTSPFPSVSLAISNTFRNWSKKNYKPLLHKLGVSAGNHATSRCIPGGLLGHCWVLSRRSSTEDSTQTIGHPTVIPAGDGRAPFKIDPPYNEPLTHSYDLAVAGCIIAIAFETNSSGLF